MAIPTGGYSSLVIFPDFLGVNLHILLYEFSGMLVRVSAEVAITAKATHLVYTVPLDSAIERLIGEIW